MNIYSCVDHKNIDKIFVLYYSVFKNTKNFDNLNFFIITDDYPKIKIPKFLKSKIKIGIIKFDEYWTKILNEFNDNFYKKANWCKSNLNFARFFVFEIFNIDRVVYLDWDMIVQRDIYDLIDKYLTDEIIVCNLKNNENILKNIILEPNKINIDDNNYIKENFNTSLKNQSFNSGFYIISRDHFNLQKMSKFINKLIFFQKKRNLFKFGTQIIMNLLPYKFNFIDYEWNCGLIDEKSYIIHYSGGNKPWKNNDKIWYKYYYGLYPKNEEITDNKKSPEIKRKLLFNKILYKN